MVTMMQPWLKRIFPNTEAIWLGIILFVGFLLVISLSDMLAPVYASIVIAYLLQWIVTLLEKKIPHLWAVVIVFVGFLTLFLSFIFVMWPIVWRQTLHLVDELPAMLNRLQTLIYLLPDKFPEFFSEADVETFTAETFNQFSRVAKNFLSASLASIPNIIAFIVYLFLVPLLVFYFLKDKFIITRWSTAFLPEKKQLLKRVWNEVDGQIGNYVRGKAAEVIIIGSISFLCFSLLRLEYALLLSLGVGLSVLVPYIGAVAITFPVILVALFQWGWGADFAYVLIAYGVIQTFDAIVLVPVLFSEAVSLHPVAIIIAILFFGGVWGFWGVFFAIPLATLVKAVLSAWYETQNSLSAQAQSVKCL